MLEQFLPQPIPHPLVQLRHHRVDGYRRT
jgi:hypothetical protein